MYPFFNWIPPIPFWYIFLCFYHKKPPVPGINCSWINSVMLEQNHVKKASEIAMTAMAFSVWKLALWCLHDISTPKFKISFDRKKLCDWQQCTFLILYGISEILVSYVSTYVCRNTIHISPTFSVCASNFLNRYFVNAICSCVYFFQNPSKVGIFFYPAFFYQV